jgi:Domain of unknown function (DU1801)
MLNKQDNFYLQSKEPVKSCLLALREIILSQDRDITPAFKYGMPFFCYRGKMFCYLWVHKKTGQPYIGFVEGKYLQDTELLAENRSRMKIFLLNTDRDIPVRKICTLLQKAIGLYKTGIIKTKS